MLDSLLRPSIDPPLKAMAAVLYRWGVSANMLTAVGFVFSLCSFAALGFAYYGWALIFLAVSRLMDGLDGTVARLSQPTDLGGFYDIVSDFIFYSGIAFFFAVGRPEFALSAAFLVFSFVGTGSSFLAYAILAAKNAKTLSPQQNNKSFVYLGGLTEGSESILALVLICLFPDQFNWIAYSFGILCWLTTCGRVAAASRDFGNKA
ncbi:MAG TPA: CDP-alcohol phosphatidyltransferase [Rhodospirillaceae bacterium]|nr:CDP-alcohol phosphatidyltransferase [Rhodospirillaceae bacterium]